MAGAVTPIFNILVGLACIVGGVTGKLALFGTGSGMALAVAGSVGMGIGIFQLWRRSAR